MRTAMSSAQIVELQEETAQPSGPARPKLFLATPCYGCMLTVQYLQCLLQTQLSLSAEGIGIILQTVGNESLITRARNLLTKQFLGTDATHLLFIDADISWDPAAILRLLEKDEGVVSTSYPKKFYDWKRVEERLRSATPEPLHQAGLDFNLNVTERTVEVSNGFARVLDAATGFMLVKRGAIERMYEHYKDELLVVNDLVGASQAIKDYVALFDCMIDPQTRRSLSEDFAFSRRWQQMGEHVYMDLNMPLGHTGALHFEGDIRHRLRSDKGARSLRSAGPEGAPTYDEAEVGGDGRRSVLLALLPTEDGRVSVGFMMSISRLVTQLAGTQTLKVEVQVFKTRNAACDYTWQKGFETVVLVDGMLAFEPDIVLDMLHSQSPFEVGVYPKPKLNWEQMTEFVDEPVSCRALEYAPVVVEGQESRDRVEASTAGLGLAKLDRCVLKRVSERLDPRAVFNGGKSRLWFHDGVMEDRQLSYDEMFCRIWGEGVTLNLRHPVTLLGNHTFAGVVMGRKQIR